MRNTIALILFLSVTTICFAQKVETRYFTSQWLTKEVSKGKAKFSQTRSDNTDGTVTIEIKDLTNNIIVRSETYKGNEPFGMWKHRSGQRISIIDYNFQLIYSDGKCFDSIPGIRTSYFHDNDTVGYTAPKLKTGHSTISQFISKNIIYPSRAMDDDIQGTVKIMFTLTKEGNVENVLVARGVNIILDKEAARVVRQLKFLTPPSLRGQPFSLSCVTLPIQFLIE